MQLMSQDTAWMLNITMFQCSNVPMFQFSNVQIFKSSNAQMFKCSNLQMFICSNVKCQMSIGLNFCRIVPLEFLQSFFIYFYPCLPILSICIHVYPISPDKSIGCTEHKDDQQNRTLLLITNVTHVDWSCEYQFLLWTSSRDQIPYGFAKQDGDVCP